MKRFINAKGDIVTEALDGFLATTPNTDLARLDGYPHTKVIVRTDWDKSQVALISGGGSGHEPAHAGFVGKGMLSAVVCGEIFAAPTVEAVLAAILAVTGDAGCLLIVKNYTGDRLNFGLAAERAKALGKNVEMVIVADDVALIDAHQPRGLAGTLFVHKIAGHLADQGASLAEVAKAARAVAETSHSIGLSLDTCTVPGNPKADYLGADKAELGLGIHGEPGAQVIDLDTAERLMVRVCAELARTVDVNAHRYAAIMNNLGAVPPLEMAILAHAFGGTPLGRATDLVIGPAQLMTSLDMNGFSVSVMQLDEERTTALRSPVKAPDWPGLRQNGKVNVVAMPDIGGNVTYSASENAPIKAAVVAVCTRLIKSEDTLNALDARIGDGDTGSTCATAARHILGVAETLPFADAAKLCAALSRELTRNMGGSSGVLLAILFAAAGDSFQQETRWPTALMAGAERMMEYGGARRGDRTMLDALLPALDTLLAGKTLKDASDAARKGAENTAIMEKSLAGRSSYVPAENLRGVIDPGAEAVALCLVELAAIAP